MPRREAYIGIVGFKSPLPINEWVHPRRCTSPWVFSFVNQGLASASSGAPVTRQMRQSGKISAPIDL
jgi:hypothetical protein